MPLALGVGMHEMQASEIADQFVNGLDYPIAKADIVSAAREASLGPTILDALRKLPDREYVDAEDLIQQLNAAA
jgi:hypothetical protein